MAVNDDQHKGMFGAARALLGKVVERAVDAALGTSRPPEAPDRHRDESVPQVSAAPVRSSAPATLAQASADEPVVAVATSGERVHLAWALTPEAVERARRVLGDEGELRARVIVVARDDDQVVSTDIREQSAVSPRGEWMLTDVPSGARCTAAVGLGADDRFVSAGHARVITA